MVRVFRSGCFAVLVLSAVLALPTPTLAQEAAAQPAAAAPPAMTLDQGAGMFFHQIKADRTADFEWLMGKIKEAFQKSEDATQKQQAAGIHVFKSTDPGQNGNVLYIVMVNPAVAGADYSMQNMMKIVYAAFPAEQQDIYKRLQGAFGGATNRVNLQSIADFGK